MEDGHKVQVFQKGINKKLWFWLLLCALIYSSLIPLNQVDPYVYQDESWKNIQLSVIVDSSII